MAVFFQLRRLYKTTLAVAGTRCRASVLGLLAAVPACFVAVQVAMWVRNIPNWDEFDTVLDFLLALDAGANGADVMERLFAVTNEHRMFVSRLIFAGAYWATNTINFAALAILGNLFLVAAFAQLVVRTEDTMARLRLAAIFGLVVFQLQHHENLFWSGASIDHFFVILAAVTALGALTARGGWSLSLGCIAAILGSFSLAHGLLVWPLGAVLLAADRRWRECAIWLGVAALSGLVYFAGFQFNSGHRLPGIAELPQVLGFWLTLAGSSPALDNVATAPWYGALLVGATLFVLRRGWQPRERFALAVVIWCLGAVAMIAWGRGLLAPEWVPVTSRYVILSSMAWALLIWVAAERALAQSVAPAWWLAALFLVLIGFNVRANAAHLAAGRVFAQMAERAVFAFHRDGTFAHAEPPLYPDADRADALLRAAVERRIFQLPPVEALELTELERVDLAGADEIGHAEYCIDAIEQHADHVWIRGWAFRPKATARLGELAVLFRSADCTVAFEAVPRLRPDVAAACERSDAIYAGFELRLPYDKLPPGEFGLGVCFDAGNAPEYMMTANIIRIPQPPKHPAPAQHAAR